VILNILIILFLLAMVYWWGAEGFFSALLHLASVIIAGSLALAFWEPLSQGFLLGRMPAYAQGVGLVCLFILLLILVRVAFDLGVKANLHFSSITNFIGGGACGLASGVLTAGLTVIAVGFLPGPSALGGYEPYILAKGGVADNEGGGLWVPVDDMAAGFFGGLSNTAFSTDTPLATFRPRIAEAAALSRLRVDSNASASATTENVKLTGIATLDTITDKLGDAAVRAAGDNARIMGHRFVVIDTQWTNNAGATGTFDRDAALRLYPTQLRLVTVRDDASDPGEPLLHAPFGAGVITPGDSRRRFTPFNEDTVVLAADTRGMDAAIGFLIPEGRKPRFLFVRNLRFTLTGLEDQSPRLASLLGAEVQIETPEDTDTAEQPDTPDKPTTGDTIATGGRVFGDVKLELTNKLPMELSRNNVSGRLEVGDSPTDKNAILRGRGEIRRPEVNIPQSVRIDKLHIPSHLSSIRMEMTRVTAQSLLGAAVAQAASLESISVSDSTGQEYLPVGYFWHRPDGFIEIRYTIDEPLRNARELPISKMRSNEKVMVYFTVPKGIKLTTLKIGSKSEAISVNVP